MLPFGRTNPYPSRCRSSLPATSRSRVARNSCTGMRHSPRIELLRRPRRLLQRRLRQRPLLELRLHQFAARRNPRQLLQQQPSLAPSAQPQLAHQLLITRALPRRALNAPDQSHGQSADTVSSPSIRAYRAPLTATKSPMLPLSIQTPWAQLFSIPTACSSVVPGGTSVKSDFTSSSCVPDRLEEQRMAADVHMRLRDLPVSRRHFSPLDIERAARLDPSPAARTRSFTSSISLPLNVLMRCRGLSPPAFRSSPPSPAPPYPADRSSASACNESVIASGVSLSTFHTNASGIRFSSSIALLSSCAPFCLCFACSAADRG